MSINTIIEEQKKYKALKNHICGNNDGKCKCECFDKGYRKALKDVRNIQKHFPVIYNSQQEERDQITHLTNIIKEIK